MTFSQRYKNDSIGDTSFFVFTINDALRENLFRPIKVYTFRTFRVETSEETYNEHLLKIWTDYFKKSAEDFESEKNLKDYVLNHLNTAIWYEVYELIEFLITEYESEVNIPSYKEYCTALNNTLRKHNSPYRIFESRFVMVTTKNEDNVIVELFERLERGKWQLDKARLHFNSIILSRKNGDYAEIINDSMSMLNEVVTAFKPDNPSLELLINQINEVRPYNPVNPIIKNLATLFSNGFRVEENVKYEDAKLIFTLCSSMCNFLIDAVITREYSDFTFIEE